MRRARRVTRSCAMRSARISATRGAEKMRAPIRHYRYGPLPSSSSSSSFSCPSSSLPLLPLRRARQKVAGVWCGVYGVGKKKKEERKSISSFLFSPLLLPSPSSSSSSFSLFRSRTPPGRCVVGVFLLPPTLPSSPLSSLAARPPAAMPRPPCLPPPACLFSTVIESPSRPRLPYSSLILSEFIPDDPHYRPPPFAVPCSLPAAAMP